MRSERAEGGALIAYPVLAHEEPRTVPVRQRPRRFSSARSGQLQEAMSDGYTNISDEDEKLRLIRRRARIARNNATFERERASSQRVRDMLLLMRIRETRGPKHGPTRRSTDSCCWRSTSPCVVT